MRERHGRVEAITAVDGDVFLVEVAALDPRPVSWQAGQFVSVRIDETGDRRSYSIVTPPGRAESFELLVAGGSPGGGTARFVAGLEPGAELRYFGPMGYFTFEPGHQGALFFGATGVGISAVLPMLAAAAADPAPTAIELHWSVRDRSGAVLADRIEAIVESDERISMQMYMTAAGSERLTRPMVRSIRAAVDPRIYLCGNPEMIADVCQMLSQVGFDVPGRVRTELFAPPSVPLQL